MARRSRSLAAAATMGVAAIALFWVPSAALGADAWVWRLPPGMPVPWVPADNPITAAKRDLGERLFHEPLLSANGTVSCASCHVPALAFTDGRARSPGATGELTERSAMSLVNVAYAQSLGWTNAEPRTLEQQMLEPLFNEHPLEMGVRGREATAIAALSARSDYPMRFRTAFPQAEPPWTMTQVIQAIATYLRTVIAADSPFDRWLYRGDANGMNDAARRGLALFFGDEAGCARCHSGPLFSGPWRDAEGSTGPAAFADNGLGAGAVRVPTLRNIARTAPYMHDGRFADLDAVLRHYAGAAANNQDPRLPQRGLTDAQRQDLHAFLESLSETPDR